MLQTNRLGLNLRYYAAGLITLDQYKGCLLGLAFGDALGAKYEGGFLERGLWFVMGRTQGRMRFTDDTQMSVDIVKSILECGKIDQDHLAKQFAKSYRWSRGYGPGAAKTLKMIGKGVPWNQANRSQFKDGSYGNGAAMRASVLALFYQDKEKLISAIHQVSEITHTHVKAIVGAQLVGLATHMALLKKEHHEIVEELISFAKESVYKQKLIRLKEFMSSNHQVTLRESKKLFGNSIAAEYSCITAIMTALQFLDKPYFDMIQFICKCGGDTDTISAMAGAIWSAKNGFEAIQNVRVNQIETGEEIENLSKQIYEFTIQHHEN